ncbi:DUF4230 domain-containing protein [Flavobacterium sp. SUN052]|uniref:DUF4230 domain-containing protein n=1 Tax=Flavobacterium sp. SUN052 TaxID=3002441 RepID=UPI00237D7B0D|nr:DUF4230 domain-containing protein [Flavobacterium sp. SUN052]MEC4004730.1 DUF4230 domain-containing protein [Flavobacterium sp. SUN052]
MTQQTSQKISFFRVIIELRKWFVLILIALVLFFGYKYFTSKSDSSTVEYDTALIQEQIKNVGKLVVTEGHFSEVMTYKDSQKYLGNLISFDKKALVVINADVTVGFDLSKVKYDIDAENKIVTITNIPVEEIKISPDIKYYNVDQSTFNAFTGNDYNKINKIAKENLAKKIAKSTLKSNAKNRLISELSKILIVTNSMGWKLQYNGQVVEDNTELQQKIKG